MHRPENGEGGTSPFRDEGTCSRKAQTRPGFKAKTARGRCPSRSFSIEDFRANRSSRTISATSARSVPANALAACDPPTSAHPGDARILADFSFPIRLRARIRQQQSRQQGDPQWASSAASFAGSGFAGTLPLDFLQREMSRIFRKLALRYGKPKRTQVHSVKQPFTLTEENRYGREVQ